MDVKQIVDQTSARVDVRCWNVPIIVVVLKKNAKTIRDVSRMSTMKQMKTSWKM